MTTTCTVKLDKLELMIDGIKYSWAKGLKQVLNLIPSKQLVDMIYESIVNTIVTGQECGFKIARINDLVTPIESTFTLSGDKGSVSLPFMESLGSFHTHVYLNMICSPNDVLYSMACGEDLFIIGYPNYVLHVYVFNKEGVYEAYRKLLGISRYLRRKKSEDRELLAMAHGLEYKFYSLIELMLHVSSGLRELFKHIYVVTPSGMVFDVLSRLEDNVRVFNEIDFRNRFEKIKHEVELLEKLAYR